ncbi:MAG: electron transport complex subunit RsxA [Firmicutes bacterium]|nr:electron transport complex subunit RsxA [Bacillota bacterium]
MFETFQAEYVVVTIALLFGANYVVAQGWGLCPFVGVSRKVESAIGIGFATVFVTTMSSILLYLLFTNVVVPGAVTDAGFMFLDILILIVVIASFVGITEIFIKKFVPTLYSSLGIYLPLLATNCLILQVTIRITNPLNEYGLLTAALHGLFGGLGFLLVIVLLAGMREKMARIRIPRPFAGFPISLVAAGIIGLAFLGLVGLLQL